MRRVWICGVQVFGQFGAEFSGDYAVGVARVHAAGAARDIGVVVLGRVGGVDVGTDKIRVEWGRVGRGYVDFDSQFLVFWSGHFALLLNFVNFLTLFVICKFFLNLIY